MPGHPYDQPTSGQTKFATIRLPGALLRVPATTAYDREIALEHAEHCARRYGSAALELDGCRWSLRRDERGHVVVCGKRARTTPTVVSWRS